MQAGQAPHVVLAVVRVVGADVFLVIFAQFFDGRLNVPASERAERCGYLKATTTLSGLNVDKCISEKKGLKKQHKKQL